MTGALSVTLITRGRAIPVRRRMVSAPASPFTGLSDVAVAAVVVAEAERHYYGGVVLEQRHFQDVASTFEGATGR